MSEPSESKHVELKRKSKKFKKTYNLLDFVVIKTKNKKNQQTKRVKVHKQIQKRGKIRKKKVTTIKKRILKERIAKQALADKDAKLLIDEASELVKEFSQIQLNSTSHEEVKDQPLTKASVNVISLLQHSKNFREYCNHFITQEIKRLTELVLKDLFKFQEKKFEQNPGEEIKLRNAQLKAKCSWVGNDLFTVTDRFCNGTSAIIGRADGKSHQATYSEAFSTLVALFQPQHPHEHFSSIKESLLINPN